MSATMCGIAAGLPEDTSAGSFSRLSLNQIERSDPSRRFSNLFYSKSHPFAVERVGPSVRESGGSTGRAIDSIMDWPIWPGLPTISL